MKNDDGRNVFLFFKQVVSAFENVIEEYTYTICNLNEHERVYIIQDSFILYVGIINYGNETFPNYRVVFEELLYNDIYKFNFSKFSRSFSNAEQLILVYKRFHGIWGEPIRSLEDNRLSHTFSEEYKQHYFIPSKCYEISEKIPSLCLRDRFEHWNGILHFYVIYELIDNDRTGYAIYCSQNPQIHKVANKMANNVEQTALEYYSYISHIGKEKAKSNFSRYQFEWQELYGIHNDVNCDEIIIDLLCERIEKLKANGWHHKNRNKLCLAEHEMKYFILERYAKSKGEAQSIGGEIFQEVHVGKFKNEPRYEYIIPDNKWKSEQMVYEIVKKLYKKHTVLYQHRPYFLRTNTGQMSYDIFICGLNVAIEYQGKQHFEPVEIFGGEEYFKEQVIRDKLKKELSEKNGIKLVYINYNDDLSPDLIKSRIESV